MQIKMALQNVAWISLVTTASLVPLATASGIEQPAVGSLHHGDIKLNTVAATLSGVPRFGSFDGLTINSFEASSWAKRLSVLLILVAFFGGVEAGLHWVFRKWHERGGLNRFHVDAPDKIANRTLLSIVTFAAPTLMGLSAIAAYHQGFLAMATFEVNLSAWLWSLVFMIAHDAWFFGMHTLLHLNKRLYRAVHYPHHTPNAMTLLEGMDLFFTVATPYVLGAAFIYNFASELNLAAVLIQLTATFTISVMAHANYDLPHWVQVVLSLGYSALPYAVSARSHYLHHTDPRYNRGLYFTYLDKLAGTFREDHPSFAKPAKKVQ